MEDLNQNQNLKQSSKTTTNANRSINGNTNTGTINSQSTINGDIFIAIFLVILGLSAIIFYLILFFRKMIFNNTKAKNWKKLAFLEISVPKDTAEQVQKEKAGGGGNGDKDMIGMGEQLFAVLSEYASSRWKNWLNMGPTFSFEITCLDQEVRFWLVGEVENINVIEKQVVALYPKAHIVRIKDSKKIVDFFKPDTVAYSQELILGKRFELPFKTYKLMESDPLNVITNSLTGLAKEESVSIQLIVTPIKDKWQKKSREDATRINQGQNPEVYLNPKFDWVKFFFKALTEIVKFLFSIITIFFEKKDDKKDFNGEKKDRRYMDVSGKYEQIQLTEQQREIVKKLEEKASKSGFIFSLRVVASSKTEARSKQLVNSIVPAFQIFDIRPFNWFTKDKTIQKQSILDYMMRAQTFRPTKFREPVKHIINTEEICSIWHLPNYLVTTPNIKWLLSRRPAIPLGIPEKGPGNVYLGTATSRGQTRDIYIKTEDRFKHIYSLGGSGSGKTVTMNNVMLQDIEAGNGICFVDPHGEGVDDILRRIPEHRLDDVIVFSPSITDKPLGLNMMEFDPLKPTQKTLVIDTLFSIWDKLYDLKKTGGPMFENYMKNSMRLVMSHPESGSTLMEISKVLSDEDFRSFKLALCDEPEVVDFWEKEALKAGGEASLENMVPYITSKLAPFITNDFLKPMIGQQKSAINFREAMDNNKIILVSLAKGLIGENSAYLVGMVIIGGLLMSGMGRSDGLKYNLDGTTTPISPLERPPFFVYIDEMQNFLFDAIPKALEEIRKYKVGFYLAHQFIKQVVVDGSERIKDSLMANCATKLIFRCSSDDAKYLESEFSPLSVQDIANPEARTYNAILLIDGQRTLPFNIGATYNDYFKIEKDPELMKLAQEKRLKAIEMTKEKYGKPRELVEQEIKDRAKLLF